MNNSIKSEQYAHHIFIKDIVRSPDNPFKNMEDGSFVSKTYSAECYIVPTVANRCGSM